MSLYKEIKQELVEAASANKVQAIIYRLTHECTEKAISNTQFKKLMTLASRKACLN